MFVSLHKKGESLVVEYVRMAKEKCRNSPAQGAVLFKSGEVKHGVYTQVTMTIAPTGKQHLAYLKAIGRGQSEHLESIELMDCKMETAIKGECTRKDFLDILKFMARCEH